MHTFATLLSALILITAATLLAPRSEAGSAAGCRGRAATIVGTAASEELVGTEGPDVIAGLDGEDVIRAAGGDDLVCGGRGLDDINGGRGNDRVFGGLRSDDLHGGPGADRLRGGGHSDLMIGGAGNDDLRNVYPDDGMRGGPGNDVMKGTSVSFADSNGPVQVDLQEGIATGEGRDRIHPYMVRGSRFDDEIRGRDDIDVLYGRGGNDTLDGRQGRFDYLNGGTGDDLVRGGSGIDIIYAERWRNDSVTVGDDTYDGGPGWDHFALGSTEIPTHVDLSQEKAFSEGADVIRDIEALYGSYNTSNRLIGDEDNNIIMGGGNGDELHGMGGNDKISGDTSVTNDQLRGGDGGDTFFPRLGQGTNVSYDGGRGRDLLDFRQQQSGPGSANVNLALGVMDASGETGTVASIEDIAGTDGPDELTGDAKNNTLDGDGGPDVLDGMDGDDLLIGGPRDDQGDGGPGSDTCREIEQPTNCEDATAHRRTMGNLNDRGFPRLPRLRYLLLGHECRQHSPAGTRCAESDVSIDHRPRVHRWSGRIDSHMGYCVRNRVVALRQVREGRDLTLAITRTDDNLAWSVQIEVDRGRFYAVAREKTRSSPPDSMDLCYRARSETVRVR